MIPLTLNNFTFHWGSQTYVMGILNVTPDSFSGDGLIQGDDWLARVVAQGRQFVAEGAHILDVGGESTRPGAEAVSMAEELSRVLPAIRALAAELDVPISVDTYKAEVAAAALDAGAVMVNDVWGLRMDPDMATLCAERHAPVIVMHNRSRPRDVIQEARLGGMYIGSNYDDLLADVAAELGESVALGRAAGIPAKHIIIDPGIGFGKTVEHNLTLINRLDYFRALGHPILLGPSNKSFIGYTLDLPPDDRMEGTAAAIAIGVARGADIVRVHQVKQMARIAKMADAIVRT
ncbi:MAG: dihydropteroate synthase [Anaerolineae bacterium]